MLTGDGDTFDTLYADMTAILENGGLLSSPITPT